jgi:cystathionine gamma-lyase
MGAIALNDEGLHNQLKYNQLIYGAVPSPFDCWLAHRGLKTLHLRVREACRNALLIGKALERSPHVLAVYYPGLESHPDRSIVCKQHREGMAGGVLSFRIEGGRDAAITFCRATKIFALAVSLGGVESLVELPSNMTHARIPKEQREESDLLDDLIRLSCGVEDGEDLREDVLQALETVAHDKALAI